MTNPIRILCYGDSNTWGYEPGTGRRYSWAVRWPGVLQQRLGGGYVVIEEGLNGRTTVWDDPLMPGRNGKEYLLPCLESHRPFELLVLALGVNDLKMKFSASAQDIARGLGLLVKTVRAAALDWDHPAPAVLLVSPPRIGHLTGLAEMFTDVHEKSRRLSTWIARTANDCGCDFVDASALVETDPRDGVHLSEASHGALAEEIALRITARFTKA